MVSDLQLMQWCLQDVGKYDDAQVEKSFIVALCLVRYVTKNRRLKLRGLTRQYYMDSAHLEDMISYLIIYLPLCLV